MGLLNADASIGSITVGGDWIASSATAGTASTDGRFGNNDDAIVTGGRDQVNLHSSIGTFTVKGQALGTSASTTDMFGVVAEEIGKAKVGGRTFAFTKTGTEAFFAAPTLDGEGAENPMFDFTIRELGTTTPTGLVAGGVNLQITGIGKVATFTDVDGDIVTVKSSSGSLFTGGFTFITAASGGGQLTKLAFNDAPGDLTITAKPGPSGGNGLVNIGSIEIPGLAAGKINVAGDLGRYVGGLAANGKPGTTSLTVHSYGILGTSTGAASTISSFAGGIGKLTVAADLRDESLQTSGAGSGFGDIKIDGDFINTNGRGYVTTSSAGSIGGVKIGGSFLTAQIYSATSIGAIAIGGDLVGGGFPDVIYANGAAVSPSKGTDVAVRSLSVLGSVEKASVRLGADGNADASIGAVTVGHSWVASNLLAAVDAASDAAVGTPDDKKLPAARDVANLYSTIASVTIKGQALGTPAGGDHFGIVAEEIGVAKIGTVKLKLTKGQRTATDFFAIAHTFPGLGNPALPFDFYLREIIA